jgi:hypothetical protein
MEGACLLLLVELDEPAGEMAWRCPASNAMP